MLSTSKHLSPSSDRPGSLGFFIMNILEIHITWEEKEKGKHLTHYQGVVTDNGGSPDINEGDRVFFDQKKAPRFYFSKPTSSRQTPRFKICYISDDAVLAVLDKELVR